MRNSAYTSLIAASLLAAMAVGPDVAGPPLRSTGGNPARRPTPPKMDAELQHEIAEHNAAVDRRKAEKKARKGRRA